MPTYSMVPLVTVVLMNLIAYFGTRLFTTQMYHHSMKLFIDDYIPLNTWFIYVYILAYIQWIIGFWLIAREEKRFCYRILYGEVIAKILCMLCFIFYPTTIDRPVIVGNDIADVLTRMIYEMDAPDNLFPSIHCLESYICFRAALGMKKRSGWYIAVNFVFSALVFASTVCLKQHVAVDMIGAVLAAELGIMISGIWIKVKER